jgi:predicted enzyme related to lactoylglutathione lyase
MSFGASAGRYKSRNEDPDHQGASNMDWTLELIVVPVTDVDRAKAFYIEQADFGLDVDHRAGDFRVVQLTPKGSACSICLMREEERAGTVKGLHLCVPDIEAAHAELQRRGMNLTGPFHFNSGGQVDGPHPQREKYGSFMSFDDPDGNSWMVQEVDRSGPSRAA